MLLFLFSTFDDKVLVESAFVEDDEFIFLAAFHTEGRYGKENLFPRKLVYFIKGQNEVSICLVYCELVGLVGEGCIVKV